MADRTKAFALIGSPLGHSLSPFIHQKLMEQSAVNGTYTLKEIRSDTLEEHYLSELQMLDGFNVTIPHKTSIITCLDGLSERAKLYGAVNTVAIKNGIATGYNTDCIGFLHSLKAAGMSLDGEVLVCGCGGVSRMFAFETVLAGAHLTVAVRESGISKAEQLKQEISNALGKDIKIALLNEVKGNYHLIINGTPVGMTPNTEACPLKKDTVITSDAVFDAIYNPYETLLIRYAKEAGKQYVNGLPMLVRQAAAAQEIWNGITFSENEIQEVIKQTQEELENE